MFYQICTKWSFVNSTNQTDFGVWDPETRDNPQGLTDTVILVTLVFHLVHTVHSLVARYKQSRSVAAQAQIPNMHVKVKDQIFFNLLTCCAFLSLMPVYVEIKVIEDPHWLQTSSGKFWFYLQSWILDFCAKIGISTIAYAKQENLRTAVTREIMHRLNLTN